MCVCACVRRRVCVCVCKNECINGIDVDLANVRVCVLIARTYTAPPQCSRKWGWLGHAPAAIHLWGCRGGAGGRHLWWCWPPSEHLPLLSSGIGSHPPCWVSGFKQRGRGERGGWAGRRWEGRGGVIRTGVGGGEKAGEEGSRKRMKLKETEKGWTDYIGQIL